ncbi:ankyrin repeat-containing domain protein [Gaertneriomyces semiglobifer]|nr:ankyrin repeat-containing domain protein [Gaertneriomyces semiglobifer]
MGIAVCSNDILHIHTSPLSVACRKGNAKIAEILLSFGADVSAADEYGVTPLHWAANSGDAVLVMLLLRMARNAGVLLPALASLSPADSPSNNAPNILGRKDLFGSTPLHFASVNNRADIARALVAAGSDPMAVNNDGRRPSELTTDIALKAYLKDEEHRMQKYHAAFQRVIRKAAAAGGVTPNRQAASASARDTSRGQSNTGAKSPSRPATTALARARSRSGPIKQASGSRQGTTKKKRVESSGDENGGLPNATGQEVFVLQQAAVAIPASNAAPPSGDSPMPV